MAYTGAASSLVHEGRLRVPTGEWDRTDSTSALSLWPPGYPAAIAIPVSFGVPPIQSARWINVLAAAVSAATIAAVVATPLGAATGAAAVVVVFATQAVVDAHLSVLSEPLFLALLLLLLATMVYARDRLLLLGVLSTMLVMVRYAGASAPAAAVTWTLLDSRYDVGRRMRRALAVAVIPALAIVLWTVRTALARDRHATPHLQVYGDWGGTIQQARDTLAAWLAPLVPSGAAQEWIALAIAVVLAGFVVTAAREAASNRTRQERVKRVASLLGASLVLIVWYLVVIVASRTFVGGTIPLDWRILLPVIVLLELMSVAAVAYWWRAYHTPMHVTIAVLALAWIAAAATMSVNDAQYAITEGSDFAGSDWRQSPLVAWVRAHGRGHPLYSNWPPALYFHAGRIARELPDSSDADDVAGFAERLRTNRGYMVGFDEPSPDVIAPRTLAAQLGLREVVHTPDGAVWTAPDSVAAPAAPAAPQAMPGPVSAPGGSTRQR